MESLKCIIIEEQESVQTQFGEIIQKFLPNIEIVQYFKDLEQGQATIQKMQPDFVLISTNSAVNCFEIFSKTSMRPENIIFTVPKDDDILNSFKFTGLNHIIKPVNLIELCLTMDKVYKQQLEKRKELKELNAMDSHEEMKILALPTNEGIVLMNPHNIVKCEDTEGSTLIQLENGEEILVFKKLKEFETQLLNESFIRLGNNQVINLNYINSTSLIQEQSILSEQIDYSMKRANRA